MWGHPVHLLNREEKWFLLKGRGHKATIRVENILASGPVTREVAVTEERPGECKKEVQDNAD
jgi:hypothetical protein